METATCHSCGTVSPAETRFCQHCGLNLHQAPEIRQAGPPAQVVAPQEQLSGPPAAADDAVRAAPSAGAADAALRLRPQATVCRGRYVVQRALDCPSAGELHRVVLARDTAAPGQHVVLEDMGSAPTTAWLAALEAAPGMDEQVVRTVLSAGGQLTMGPRLAERREQMLALDHAGLGALRDLRVEDGRIILVRDYVDGRDLQTVLDDAGGQPLDEASVLAWAQEALDVLVYLHGRQPAVIHGDIKPSRLILDGEGRVRLIGLASIGTPAARAQPPIGTAGYAPPEQFDEAPGPAWDLYALAAAMHHLLTGRDPRAFTGPGELWIFPPPRWLNAGLSERTESLIMRALEKDPRRRYPDAVGMRDDVVLARNPAPRGGRRWPWPRRDA